MFKLFHNMKKELYKRYANPNGENKSKVLAEIVEKYKAFPEKEKTEFRKIISSKMLKADKNRASDALRLAKEIGRATDWKEQETDAKMAQSIKTLMEKYNDKDITMLALDALYENNYGEAEFWESMLYKEADVALFVIEKIRGVDGAGEVFKKNLKALMPLLDRSKTCRGIFAECITNANDDIKSKLLKKMIAEGVHEELLDVIPELFEGGKTRYLLLGWLAGKNIRMKVDEENFSPEERIPAMAKKIKEIEMQLVEKAAALLPKLPPHERLALHHFLLTRGVKTKEDDAEFLMEVALNQSIHPLLRRVALAVYKNNDYDNRKEFEEEIEKMIKNALESARPMALMEACDLGMLLASLNRSKGEELLEMAYREAADVLEDEEAEGEQKKAAALVSVIYITKFKRGEEEFRQAYEKAAALLNGKDAPHQLFKNVAAE